MNRKLIVFTSFIVVGGVAGCATSSKQSDGRIVPLVNKERSSDNTLSNGRRDLNENSDRVRSSTGDGSRATIGEEQFKLHNDALVSIRKHDWITAELKLQRLIEQQPSLASPYLNLGIVYIEQERFNEAERVLSDAIGRGKKSAAIYNLLGVSLRQQGKFKQAEMAYKEAIAIDSTYASAFYNLGVLYDLYLPNYESAASNYHRYSQLEPGDEKKVAGWIKDIQKRSQASN